MTRFGLFLADLTRSATDSQGIVTYAEALIASLTPSLTRDEQLVVIARSDQAHLLDGLPAERVALRLLEPTGRMSRRALAVRAPLALLEGLSTLHFPRGFVPFGVPSAIGALTTIHDTIPWEYAAGRYPWPGVRWKPRVVCSLLRSSARRSRLVLTDSDFAAEEIVRRRIAPQDRIRVAGVAVKPARPEVPAEPAPKRPYVLHLGSPMPHKRSSDAIHIFQQARDLGGLSGAHRLVILGYLPPAAQRLAWVEHIQGPVPDSVYSALVANSECVLFPSELEGFGLPPVEALLLGRPAVYPAVRPMVDIVGWSEGEYPPGDIGAAARALVRAVNASSQSLGRARERLRQVCSSAEHAQALLDAYREAAVRSGAPS